MMGDASSKSKQGDSALLIIKIRLRDLKLLVTAMAGFGSFALVRCAQACLSLHQHIHHVIR